MRKRHNTKRPVVPHNPQAYAARPETARREDAPKTSKAPAASAPAFEHKTLPPETRAATPQCPAPQVDGRMNPAARVQPPPAQGRSGENKPALGDAPAPATPSAGEAPAAPPQAVPSPIALEQWAVCGAAVKGLSHWRSNLPCQDAVCWALQPRPILLLSDGAGSAAISEQGAETLVTGILRLLTTLEDALKPWLDAPCPSDEQMMTWSRRILLHAQGLLNDLAERQRRSERDVRATLLLAVLGEVHSFWWQLGDGMIVAQRSDATHVLTQCGKSKGEYANQTCFIDSARLEDVQCGLLPSSDLYGLALMSDGGAEKLVAHDGSRVSPRIQNWFDQVRQQQLSPDKLAVAYHMPEMWERTSLDDRSVILAARPQPPETAAPAAHEAKPAVATTIPVGCA